MGIDRIFEAVRRLSLCWEVPLCSTVSYVFWVLQTNKNIEEANTARQAVEKRATAQGKGRLAQKSRRLKTLMVVHNAVMSVFSMVVFAKTFSIVFQGLSSMPFRDFIEDSDGAILRQLSNWMWLFYISKYYEMVDTAILFQSNKTSTFLQMYHHAGAVIACWLVSISESSSGWIWVVLNSFIHSLMYCYYALTVFGVRPPFKRVLTFLQIGQFFSGLVFCLLYVRNPNIFSKNPDIRMYQYAALAFNVVYVAGLIYLFLVFERETYGKSRVPASSSAPEIQQARKTRRERRGTEIVSSIPPSPQEQVTA